MRRHAVVWSSVLAVAAGVFAVPASAANAAPTAPYTALSLASSAYATRGGAATATGAAVHLLQSTTSAVGVSTTGDPGMAVTLQPPTGQTFTDGAVYAVGTTADATTATASLTFGDRTCSQMTSGSITVREAVAGTDGTLTAFAADLDLTCSQGRFVGPLRVASAVGFQGVTLTPGSNDIGRLKLGHDTTVPITLTATGTEPLPYVASTTFGGGQQNAFSVVGDDCKARSLAPGESCTVKVRVRPQTANAVNGSLVLVTDDGVPYEASLGGYADDVADGTFLPVSPQRVLDTRSGLGGHKGPLGRGGVARLDLSDQLYGSASAVVLNLTVDRPLTAGYLTAFPTGTARPTTSSINFPAGWQGANLVTVPLGSGNRIDIYNYVGATPVIADLVGYYAKGEDYRGTGGGYHPTLVERLLDTRTWGYGKLPAGYYVTIPVRYEGDQANIGAMSVTLTAVKPTRQGYLTAWEGITDAPYTSNLNFGPKSGVVSNAAIVPAAYYQDPDCSTCATIAVQNNSPGPIDLVVDINGFFDRGALDAGIRFHPLTSPTRIVDSRTGLGAATLGPDTTRTVTSPTTVAGYDTVALDANITAVTPTAGTYVTVWPTYDDYPRPTASVLNPNAKQTVANHAIAEVGPSNRFNLYNRAGRTNLLVDVSGSFEYFPRTPADQIPRQPHGAAATPHAVPAAGGNIAGVGPAEHAG